MGDLD